MMDRRHPLALAPLALALAAPPVGAQDAVTGVDIETYGNVQTIGVEVTVSGDDDGDAVARLSYAVAGEDVQEGHDLVRVDDTHFVGTIFWLPPDTFVGVDVDLDDPDGTTDDVLTGAGRTRPITPPPPSVTGDVWHVAEDGSDGGTGNEVSPFATVAHALSVAAPGDEIVLHAGEYHESVEIFAGGTGDFPLWIRGAGDGEAILTGFDPDLLDSSVWSDEGGGVWSAALADETRYVAVDGVRLWDYQDEASLAAAPAAGGGFAWEGGRVYVRVPGGGGPSGHLVQVSTLGRAFWIEGAPDVVISDLTIRGYGSEQYSEGIMVRDGSHRVWVVGCVFENVMPGIWVKNEVDDLTVVGCTFSDVGLAEFDWHEVKARGGMESGALAIDAEYDGRGIVFTGNTVHDSFDGIHICGDTPLDHPIHADVIGNTFHHMGDDGVETDGVCPNVRIVDNRWEDMLVGISTAPAVVGPVWVIRNIVVHRNVAPGSDWMSRPLKCNVGDSRPSGSIFLYHNTGWAAEADQQGFTITDDSRWEHLVDVNNIWVGTDAAYYYVNAGDEPITLDWNLFWSTTGGEAAYWQGDHHATLADLTTATGHMGNGLFGDPLFVDPEGGDFDIETSSPALDSGLEIPGINHGWVGDGPDRGAVEHGAPVTPDPVPDSPPDTVEPVDDAGTDSIEDPIADADDASTDADAEEEAPTVSDGGCGCAVVR